MIPADAYSKIKLENIKLKDNVYYLQEKIKKRNAYIKRLKAENEALTKEVNVLLALKKLCLKDGCSRMKCVYPEG